jgi:hypothetical protein
MEDAPGAASAQEGIESSVWSGGLASSTRPRSQPALAAERSIALPTELRAAQLRPRLLQLLDRHIIESKAEMPRPEDRDAFGRPP